MSVRKSRSGDGEIRDNKRDFLQKFTAQGCVASLSKQTSKRETPDKIATYDWTERARKETGKSRSRKKDNGKTSDCYIACHIKVIIFNNYKFNINFIINQE